MDIQQKYGDVPVIEEFYSVQGEGFNTGKAAYFLRVGGCDLGCRWCDSKESWVVDPHQWIPVSEIISRMLDVRANAVVVTGGEPLLYDFAPFTLAANEAGIECMLETSGAYRLSGKWNWICLSPKKQEPPISSIFSLANELKIVVYDQTDFEWAEQCRKKVNTSCHLYLQPEWSRFKKNAHSIAEYVKQHPQWRISLQTHKYLNIP